jgi:5-methyltetrahydrofolate--homocysteine methyltransferase
MTTGDFLARLHGGEIFVADGATGTNLQQMGLPVGAPAEVWVLDNPEAIRTLNQSFADAGSDILLTCTFGATQMRLKSADLEAEFQTVNRRAIEITKEVSEGTGILVAGSIGPTGEMLAPLGTVTEKEAETDFAAQAQLLCEGGVDMIIIETQFDLNEASAAVRGVRSVHSAIPLICSFSYDRGTRTMMGVKPEDMAAKIGSMDVDVLGINCGRSLQDNLSALEQLRKVTDKPIWFKPNAGLPEMGPDGMPGYSVTPQEMGAMVPSWLAAGAQIVGGCCGTSPQHLAEIAKAAHE